jgi:hypothetical protein
MSLFKKLPSYDRLLQGGSAAVLRFPLALLSAILGTAFLVAIIENEKGPPQSTLVKLAMICALGIPLFIGLAALAESREWKRKLIFQGLGLALIAFYYFSLPANPLMPYTCMVRFALLIVALHFMVAFLPFMGQGQANGFWQYNKSLFLKFLRTALYSAVMFVGLAFALLAAKELFGINFPDRRYFQLWVIIAGTFNTWVLLAGFPQNLKTLNEEIQYPNVLKIFTQYILLPLVALYLVILYAYELKIIFKWNWPKGWVTQLVSWFSVAGILSLLLLWPLRELTENRWIRNYAKWFFRLLIPLIVMLYLAILQRVGVYGITVNRFLVLAMATGLTIITLYFIFARTKDIRLIPIIVFAIALLSAYGPWSAFAISEHSQQGRLDKLLLKSGIWADGKIAKPSTPISNEQQGELSDVIAYLAEWHGVESFSPWLSDNTIVGLTTKDGRSAVDSVTLAFGFEYIPNWKWQRPDKEHLYFRPENFTVLNIDTYEYLIAARNLIGAKDSNQVLVVGIDTCQIRLNSYPPTLVVSFRPLTKFGHNPVEFALSEPLKKLAISNNTNVLPDSALIFETELNNYNIKAIITQCSAGIYSDSVNVNSLSAYILLRNNKMPKP